MSADRQVRFALVPRVVTLNFRNYAEPRYKFQGLGQCVRCNGGSLCRVLSHTFTITGSKNRVRYTGVFVVYGSLYRGVRCIGFVIPGCSLYGVRYTGVFVV